MLISTISHNHIWLSSWILELTNCLWTPIWAPPQYPKRRLFVRSRKDSKPRDLYLELSDRFEIWQALRQQCCRCVCQISKRYDNLKYQSRGFETSRGLTKRRLFGYWDGALVYGYAIQLSNAADIASPPTVNVLRLPWLVYLSVCQ